MSKFFKKSIRKVGEAPGTLALQEENKGIPLHISIMDYDADLLIEKKEATVEECLIYLKSPAVTWIHISNIHDPRTLETLGQHFKLHSLILEDILSRSERSKLEDYKENLFIVLRMLKYNVKGKNEVDDEQISIVLGNNYVISFIESEQDVFDSVRERIRQGNNRIREKKADYLAYALIDAIVDNYFVILEKVDQNLEVLEDELFHRPKPNTLIKIQSAKKEMMLLRKSVWPMREVISHFRRIETPLIDPSTNIYMHDVYDHTIQAIDSIEGFRDIVGGMLDIYLSTINLKMNEIMKVLTVVATIFTPLLFITSLYGMNFVHMPELQWEWGYPIVLLFMFILTVGMLYLFRRKKWI